jgi:hypothetical protein
MVNASTFSSILPEEVVPFLPQDGGYKYVYNVNTFVKKDRDSYAGAPPLFEVDVYFNATSEKDVTHWFESFSKFSGEWRKTRKKNYKKSKKNNMTSPFTACFVSVMKHRSGRVEVTICFTFYSPSFRAILYGVRFFSDSHYTLFGGGEFKSQGKHKKEKRKRRGKTKPKERRTK